MDVLGPRSVRGAAGPDGPGIIAGMDLVIPFASMLSGETVPPLDGLELPHLQTLLDHMEEAQRDIRDAFSLSPPHERVAARLAGWQGGDGTLPWAAERARHDGIELAGGACGLLSPMHWRVGSEHLSVGDPEALQLDEAASRGLLAEIAPLFVEDGWVVHWGAPTRWYLVHPFLENLPTASLDRVVGRNPDPWLPEGAASRPLRRLWSEIQMLLHTHPINQRREDAGLEAVNSVWLSACGVAQAPLPPTLRMPTDLVGPARRGHWDEWAAAWQALDERELGPACAQLQAGQPLRLHLCGERGAISLGPRTGAAWRRWWPRRRKTLFKDLLRDL